MKTIAILSTLLLFIGATAQAANQTYDWVSSDGNPDGVSGSITLDASSSPVGGGSALDIVSGSLNESFLFSTFGPGDFTSTPLFTWNSSQITSMNLNAVGGFFILGESVNLTDSGYDDAVTEYNFLGGIYRYVDYSDSGSWEAVAAPDASSSAVLLGMALTGLGGLRRFRC